jgi:photosystem II stability/assembly factor-like uncharacterized protein
VRTALAAFALAAALEAPAQDEARDPAAEPAAIAPLASGSLILDLAFAGRRIVAAGERGHVLVSDDGGGSWKQSPVPVSANLTALAFADGRHGFAVGHVETILRTGDGGATWELVHFDPGNAQPLLDVAFTDASHGVAVGAYGVVYVTDDGGAVWSQVPFEPEPLPGAGTVEPEEGDLEEGIDLGFEFHLNALARGPGQRLYIGAEAGRLFRSDDAGAHWRELPSPYDGSFHGILPLDGDALLAYGLRGNLFRSEDGGMTWTAIPTGTTALLDAGARVDADTVVVAGMAGVVLLSRDGGRSFRLLQQPDRKGIAAVLPAEGGSLVVAGEGGLRRIVLPGAAP